MCYLFPADLLLNFNSRYPTCLFKKKISSSINIVAIFPTYDFSYYCRKQKLIQWKADARRNSENKTCGAKENKKTKQNKKTGWVIEIQSYLRGRRIITVSRLSSFSHRKGETKKVEGQSDHLLMRKGFFFLYTKMRGWKSGHLSQWTLECCKDSKAENL